MHAIPDKLSCLQGNLTMSKFESSNIGQYENSCDMLWKTSPWHYSIIQAIPEELSCSKGSFTLSKFQSSKRSHKDQHRTHPKCWCGEQNYKVTTWYRQFMKSYHVHNVLPEAPRPGNDNTPPARLGLRGKMNYSSKSLYWYECMTDSWQCYTAKFLHQKLFFCTQIFQ